MGDFFYFLEELLFYVVMFGPAIAAIMWFIISFVIYKCTDKSSPKLRTRRTLAIVSGCVAGVTVLSNALLVVMFFLAIAHM